VLPGGGDESARGDATAFDYALTSVIITPRLRLAIVEPSSGGESVRVREGESAEGLGGWRLVELRPRAAVFEGPGGRRELPLRVWAGGGDGVAPAPATASAAVPPPPDEDANRPLSAQGDSPVPDAAPEEPGPASAPAATDTRRQMDAIRRRIEARRAQLRREAQQSQAQPARNP
jgi:general secretion pathway protein N